jgi:NAD(P)H-dependent FMN reductase
MHLLAISGSLRAASKNTALLGAARLVAPPGVQVTRYDGLAALPPFNPDLDTADGGRLPDAVRELRRLIGDAAGVLISSPEYAHGVPGVLKNLLDWLVGSTEFPGKPIVLLSPSPQSVHAPAQLIEILTTMRARLSSPACVTIPLPGPPLDAVAMAAEPALAEPLREALARFVRAIPGDTGPAALR